MPPQPCSESFTHVLHICRQAKSEASALQLYASLCKCGLHSSAELGNHLVAMMVDVGSLSMAFSVFERLPSRNVCSWNTLMTGLIKGGNPQQAITLCKTMQKENILPDGYTYVTLIRACTELKDIHQGSKIHDAICNMKYLGSNHHVNSALIHMYAKLGHLAKAREVFDKVPCRNEVIWNALMAGYVNHERGRDALDSFKQMLQEGVSPTAVTFVCISKACGIVGALDDGREIHAEIARRGLLEDNFFVQSALVDMYAKLGALSKAQEVFNDLPMRNLVTWTTLITGYANHEYGREALECFEQMLFEGISPNAVTFACSLKACGMIGAVDKGRDLHLKIVQKGLLRSELVVGNALIDMYVKCGLLATAHEVFEELPIRDAVSWNTLMSGYDKKELYEEVLDCFERMPQDGISPEVVTYAFALKACGGSGAIDKGLEIHADIVRDGVLERELVVANALVDMYAKCSWLSRAQEVFDRLIVHDVISWTVLISRYAEQDCGMEALECFERMQLEGVCPNTITLLNSLRACGTSKDEGKGKLIHAQVAGIGLLDRDVAIGSALINMYAKCNLLFKAKEVFDKSSFQNEALWNTLIAGFTDHEHCEEALQCFDMMKLNGFLPDEVTFLLCLKACGMLGNADQARDMHAEMAEKGMLESDPAVSNMLVDTYSKCGLLAMAQEVISRLVVHDPVSWTAVIAELVKQDCSKEALQCVEKMQREGVLPNAITLNLSLKACAKIGAFERGQEMHTEVARQGLLGMDHMLDSALINMYAKCGYLAKAQEAFHKSQCQFTPSWNALISGYIKQDRAEEALVSFEEMRQVGVSPDEVTLLNALSACNHAGLVVRGCTYFSAMREDFGITTTQQHRRCMIDLLGRAGHVVEGVTMLTNSVLSCHDDRVLECSMLAACRNFGNLKLGRSIFQRVVVWEDKMETASVMDGTASTYYGFGMEEQACNQWDGCWVNNRANVGFLPSVVQSHIQIPFWNVQEHHEIWEVSTRFPL